MNMNYEGATRAKNPKIGDTTKQTEPVYQKEITGAGVLATPVKSVAVRSPLTSKLTFPRY